MRLGIVPVLALSAGIAVAAPPARVTLHYDVSQNGTAMVEVTEKLEHDARGYRIDSEWRGEGGFAPPPRGQGRGLRPGRDPLASRRGGSQNTPSPRHSESIR